MDEGVGAGDGKPGSIAREGDSLHVYRPLDFKLTQGRGGQHDTSRVENCRDGRSGNV
jgi:hypothetical protein